MNQCSQLQPAAGKNSGGNVPGITQLTNEIEKAMSCLREEVMQLNETFTAVLRPEEVAKCQSEQETRVMAPLEHWLYTQLASINTCIERLNNYKNRCQL